MQPKISSVTTICTSPAIVIVTTANMVHLGMSFAAGSLRGSYVRKSGKVVAVVCRSCRHGPSVVAGRWYRLRRWRGSWRVAYGRYLCCLYPLTAYRAVGLFVL